MNKLIVIPVMLTLALLLTACTEDGPAEQAGEKIDQTVEESSEAVGDAVNKAASKIEEAGDVIREKSE